MTVDREPISETPTFEEGTWEAFAFASAVLLFFGMLAAAAWVIAAEDIELAQKRTAVAAAFVTAGAAIVTFCTVTWRGKLNERQTNTSQAQLRVSEDANLASLLQKGAEMLSEDLSSAKLNVGIVSLASLIETRDERFARPAMDLLAQFLGENFKHSNASPLAETAIAALSRGHLFSLDSNRHLIFEESENAEYPPTWRIVNGVASVVYSGGDIFGSELSRNAGGARFFSTTVRIAVLDDFLPFNACTFSNCQIREITAWDLNNHTFNRCDFSNAFIDGVSQLTPETRHALKRRWNWYSRGLSPRSAEPFDWNLAFHEGEPTTELFHIT